MSVQFEESKAALETLGSIKACIDDGVKVKALQATPHLVLLDKSFYTEKLKPLLAQWMVVWLNSTETMPINNEKLVQYLLVGKKSGEETLSLLNKKLTDAAMKMVNLSHEWLSSILPFVLGRIDRVTFGLLSPTDIKLTKEAGVYLSPNRVLLAVPFVGKDVPSQSSEFSHPDVKIGLTIAAYRLEGLRMKDFHVVLRLLSAQMREEFGTVMDRPSSQTWIKWITLIGRRVRGTKSACAS